MKKIFLTLLVVNSLVSYGQFVKGDKFLSGSFSFSTQRAPDSPNGGLTNKVNSLSIQPSFGILLNEKFAVGMSMTYRGNYDKATNFPPLEYKTQTTSLGTGLFARRYITISEKLLFSLTGQVGFSRSTGTYTVTNTSTNTSTVSNSDSYEFSTGVYPSLHFFPSPKWAIDAGIGNLSYRFNQDLKTDKHSSFFNASYNGLSLGLSYYFRKS